MRVSDKSGARLFRRRAVLLGAASVAFVAAARPQLASAGQIAARARFKADRVVVLKSRRRLVLMRGDRVLRVYRVALGRYPTGHKLVEGDGRTPEGLYTLDSRLEDSKFHRAIHISYPNPRDTQRASFRGQSPGGSIMIHGLPNKLNARQVGHPAIDWTQGCIAVTNREIDEIWAMIDDGTPIDIFP